MGRQQRIGVVGMAVVIAAVWGGVAASSARASTGTATWAPAVWTGDTLIVGATWSAPCDGRGCVEGYRLAWTMQRDTGKAVPVLDTTVAETRATLRLGGLTYGEAVTVCLTITPIRRGRAGGVSTSCRAVELPDADPPAVDSIWWDSTQVAARAWRDSFPAALWSVHSATGWQYHIATGDSLPLPHWGGDSLRVAADHWTTVCGVAENRYTRARVLLMPDDLTDPDARAEHVAQCRRVVDRLATSAGG